MILEKKWFQALHVILWVDNRLLIESLGVESMLNQALHAEGVDWNLTNREL